jgi:hypothetical protein
MTQLEKLYQSIQNLKELGVQLPDKLIDETNRVEEEIIKNDIVPALAETISPIITQIQREIILVVEYIPDEPLSVKLTRKRSFAIPSELDKIEVNKNIKERETYTISPHSKSKKTGLSVKFPTGKIISEKFAAQTIVDAIVEIGADKVRQLNILCCGVPLVADKPDDFYRQYQINGGLFVMTHSSTSEKKKQLDEISNRLKLGLKVQIV